MKKKWILLIVLAAAAAALFLGKDLFRSGTGEENGQELSLLDQDEPAEENAEAVPPIIVNQGVQDASEEAGPEAEEEEIAETGGRENSAADENMPTVSFDENENSSRKTSSGTGQVNKKTNKKKNSGKETKKTEETGADKDSGDQKETGGLDNSGDGKEAGNTEKNTEEPNVPVKEEEGNLDKSAGAGVDPDEGWGAPQK